MGTSWPRAWRVPVKLAGIKQVPEDFQVTELLPFSPSGEGEHVLVRIEKVNQNTATVAHQLALFADVSDRAVSWAGRKDRRALTQQWFSVHLPGRRDPPWQAFNFPGTRVIETGRHHRKLRPGTLAKNHFSIFLRNVETDRDALVAAMGRIANEGVPNYFGPQRFGRDGNNLMAARALLLDRKPVRSRNKRGLFLSAARAWLFNCVLAERVFGGSWNTLLPGELVSLVGSHSCFLADEIDSALLRRLAEWDISPSGPLPGKERMCPINLAGEIERAVLNREREMVDALIQFGLTSARRSLRLRPELLKYYCEQGNSWRLDFDLPPGGYATAVLREVVAVEDDVHA